MVQCVFLFKSQLTDVISNSAGQVGQVILCNQKDVMKPAYTDKGNMTSAPHAISSKATENVMLGVECDPALDQ